MNILISTTTNWNPGDQWILKGCKNILKHIFPQANYIHYDRSPNNMIDWPNDQNIKSGLRGTFMNNPIEWSKIDLVVLAGSPEFLHHPLAPIYEGLASHPEIPLWAIGVGYTEPYFVLPFTDAETKVLTRESTLIITRQKELTKRLFIELRKPSYPLPCPALFCLEDYPEKTRGTLLPNHIAHSLDELTDETYFSSDPYDMLNFIGSHKFVTSKRLHGAIAAISSGAFTTLENDSFRAQSAIEMFKEVMESSRTEITPFKTRILNEYITLIKKHYADTER